MYKTYANVPLYWIALFVRSKNYLHNYSYDILHDIPTFIKLFTHISWNQFQMYLTILHEFVTYLLEVNVNHGSLQYFLQNKAWGQNLRRTFLSPARAQTILFCSPWYPEPVKHHHVTFLIKNSMFLQKCTSYLFWI